MGLRLRLRPHERIIINGCVVTNGDRRNTITVSSFGQVLRSKDILQPEDATTPVQKLYFAVQMLLINGGPTDAEMPHVNRLGSFAFISTQSDEERGSLLAAMEHTHSGDYYKALTELRPMLKSAAEAEPGGAAYPKDLEEADQAFRSSATAQFSRLEKDQQPCS